MVFVLLFIALPLFLHFYKPATCFDNIQNQGEQGIDCGGPCQKMCDAQFADLNVLWAQKTLVQPGIYNVLAKIENPNIEAALNQLNYVFKLYDKDGVLLTERYGSTFITANRNMAIFEGELITRNRVAYRVDFSILSQSGWVKQSSLEAGLSISGEQILNEETKPRVEAMIENKTINAIKNIEGVVIVYDINGNAIAFSRTIIDSIDGRGSQQVVYTWPASFAAKEASLEIILKVLK